MKKPLVSIRVGIYEDGWVSDGKTSRSARFANFVFRLSTDPPRQVRRADYEIMGDADFATMLAKAATSAIPEFKLRVDI